MYRDKWFEERLCIQSSIYHRLRLTRGSRFMNNRGSIDSIRGIGPYLDRTMTTIVSIQYQQQDGQRRSVDSSSK